MKNNTANDKLLGCMALVTVVVIIVLLVIILSRVGAIEFEFSPEYYDPYEYSPCE